MTRSKRSLYDIVIAYYSFYNTTIIKFLYPYDFTSHDFYLHTLDENSQELSTKVTRQTYFKKCLNGKYLVRILGKLIFGITRASKNSDFHIKHFSLFYIVINT